MSCLLAARVLKPRAGIREVPCGGAWITWEGTTGRVCGRPARPAAQVLEAAELTADDLDADLVAGLPDLRDRHLKIVSYAAGLFARQALFVARSLLERFDEAWDVARDHDHSLANVQ